MTQSDKSERETFERPETLVSATAELWLRRALYGFIGLVFVLFIVFPLYWSVTAAFKPSPELFTQLPALTPINPTLSNIERLLSETLFLTYLKNSVIVGIGATIISVVLATLGGYGLARSNFRGRTTVARGILFVYMFPPIMLAIPLYKIFYELDLLNSYLTLMLAHTSIILPFNLWLMWQFFQTIPTSFEEIAWINGAGRIRTLREVILPMTRPGIIAISIFSFAATWNDFTFAVVLMTDDAKRTLPVGVAQFVETTVTPWGLINASGLFFLLPPFLIVVFLQRYILEGFSASGFD